MQCPGCGTILSDSTNDCSVCGRVLQASPPLEKKIGGLEQPVEEEASEPSGTDSLPPYVSASNISGTRRRKFLRPVIILVSLLTLLAMLGSVLAGILIGRASAVTGSSHAPVATPRLDDHQFYQQVINSSPTYTEPLTDPKLSQWNQVQAPDYGCEMKNDGLHISSKTYNTYYYCTPGLGSFSSFAFQVSLNTISGDGGGITFRGDTALGNYYFLHMYLDGFYRLYLAKTHKPVKTLAEGNIDTTTFYPGHDSTLTVIARGSLFYFYANQVFFRSVRDSTYSDGVLGVVADDYDTPAEVVYTNAKIWVL